MKLFSTAILLLLSATAFCQQAEVRTKNFNLLNGNIAINGCDPVAYFTQNKAVKGSKENAVSYDGVVYYFSSVADKEACKKTSAKYEPKYGGWCAYAMWNSGEKVEIDPETFKLNDGKLYLFDNKYFSNTLKGWNKDENNLQTKADSNWKKLYPKG